MTLMRGIGVVAACLLVSVTAAHEDSSSRPPKPTVDADGTVHLPAFSVPPSPLASKESVRSFVEHMHGVARQLPAAGDINAQRKALDDIRMRPAVERLLALFSVSIVPAVIGGVQTDIIEPQGGVPTQNKDRVLINLHGGGFQMGARYGGQQESIPIASLGKIRVITVDYRLAPESRFPAASEDVAAVYKALLKQHQAGNIGVYGCSAGGLLTAQSIAWFQKHGLPIPGAVGLFGGGAVPALGESLYAPAGLGGGVIGVVGAHTNPYFAVTGLDLKDALVSPGYTPSVLAAFPPALLISGTRDVSLSSVVYTHAQLVKAGIDADLHVWEGQIHCSFAQPKGNPDVPENWEAWTVVVKFFEKHLR